MTEDITIPTSWSAMAKIGIPGAIAIFLVYRLASGFDAIDDRLKAVELLSAETSADAENDRRRIEDMSGRTYMSIEKVLYVLRTMCVNEAKTAEARRVCLIELPQ